MDIDLPLSWKKRVAKLAKIRPLSWALYKGVQLFVPRQRIGVALVAFNSDGQVFLLRHVFHPVAPWGLPGGWLGRNEDPAQGIVRELAEETGLSATIGPPAYVTYEAFPPHVGMAYLGWIRPGQLNLSSEILEACWFDLTNLPSPLHSFTMKAIVTARKLVEHKSAPAADSI